MNGWSALDRFLRTDPRDVGCAQAMGNAARLRRPGGRGRPGRGAVTGHRGAPAGVRPMRRGLRRAAGCCARRGALTGRHDYRPASLGRDHSLSDHRALMAMSALVARSGGSRSVHGCSLALLAVAEFRVPMLCRRAGPVARPGGRPRRLPPGWHARGAQGYRRRVSRKALGLFASKRPRAHRALICAPRGRKTPAAADTNKE
jgi:hypothetical protein